MLLTKGMVSRAGKQWIYAFGLAAGVSIAVLTVATVLKKPVAVSLANETLYQHDPCMHGNCTGPSMFARHDSTYRYAVEG